MAKQDDAEIMLSNVVSANERCAYTQGEHESQVELRGRLIREALASGVAATAIAEALGVSRQRVYQMGKQR